VSVLVRLFEPVPQRKPYSVMFELSSEVISPFKAAELDVNPVAASVCTVGLKAAGPPPPPVLGVAGVHFAYRVMSPVIGVVKTKALLKVVLSVYQPAKVEPVIVAATVCTAGLKAAGPPLTEMTARGQGDDEELDFISIY
jgi:hypothetical protein